MDDRNPLIIPEPGKSEAARCPKCQGPNYDVTDIHGVFHMKCKSCGQEWQGGLPQLPRNPRLPYPPEPPRAGSIEFVAKRSPTGEVIGVDEIRQRVDLTQEFRKGAPIDEEEEF